MYAAPTETLKVCSQQLNQNVFLYFLRKYNDLYFYIRILNLNTRLSLKSFKPLFYSLLILLPSTLIYAFVKLELWDSKYILHLIATYSIQRFRIQFMTQAQGYSGIGC